ncbi:MAG: hypothetical protein Ta2A_00070 [Treponemataceae bacterium]|nr:MAG: hypothetical protein Ta2A_00070 [Treponemataceae bacterium]
MEIFCKTIDALIKQSLCTPLDAIAVVLSLVTLFFAWFIPQRIMINQIYADLLKEYRSPEMGVAILAIFHFYTQTCKNNASKINDEYEKMYNKQIEEPLQPAKGMNVDFSQTLHFQRRLVAQFYSDFARLRYEYIFPRLPKKLLKTWFTENEVTLLQLLLLMAEPAGKVFENAKNVPEPSEDDVPMNQSIQKLYEEVRELV